mmetsp:Transcript_2188/g.4045  ORF Transcript_2188/g.4045 Transcript_2188/m.4045 type:complete len:720 (+) Transcript_2188:76-2235(+)
MPDSESSDYEANRNIAMEDEQAKMMKKQKQKHTRKRQCRDDAPNAALMVSNIEKKSSDRKSSNEIISHRRPFMNDTGKTPKKRGKSSITDSSDDDDNPSKRHTREKKSKKSKKRKKKQTKHNPHSSCEEDSNNSKKTKMDHNVDRTMKQGIQLTQKEVDEKVISSSAIEFYPEEVKHLQLQKNEKNAMLVEKSDVVVEKQVKQVDKINNVTLLLFYQYVEPPWDETQFQTALKFVTDQGNKRQITGRMRVAREGLNCTLTGPRDGIRAWCSALRKFDGGRPRIDPETGEKLTEFAKTEFKLTDDLPPKQRFPKLHAFEVVELVNYGLAGTRAPEIGSYGGTHLEPEDYHKKMCEKDTVIIDVRNHYEANIGRFDPPEGGAKMIDPMMRKSTEFPVWLDNPETKEMLKGKQVLMYCTGGVRCERASALLKQKMETEEDTKALGIKGVYQLQGGIDKYFKKFPEGGLWRGKNYVFDKRFAHAPPAVEAVDRTKKVLHKDNGDIEEVTKSFAVRNIAADQVMGKCEACEKPWDMYRGKRRCPTCGVPSLVCRECIEADQAGIRKLGKAVRCDLCVAEDIRNKRELKERDEKKMKEYEKKLRQKLENNYVPPIQRKHAMTRKPKPNPERITRLFLKNMCAKQMDESKLLEFLQPAKVTHIQWLTDRNTGRFYGSAFIEVKSAEDAGSVLALDGLIILGRKIQIKFQRADEKDIWPIPNTKVSS